jgi:hypothetical protein
MLKLATYFGSRISSIFGGYFLKEPWRNKVRST